MDTKSFHLGRRHAPEALLTGVNPKGEFHEIAQLASEVLLAGVAATGEIHLKNQCASEGILEGVVSKGEFHAPARCDTYFVSCEKINSGTHFLGGFACDIFEVAVE